MKFIFISLLLLEMGCTNPAKYTVGDCVTPINPDWTWYGEVAYVGFVGNSQEYKSDIYELSYYRYNLRKWAPIVGASVIKGVWGIDENTKKIPCP